MNDEKWTIGDRVFVYEPLCGDWVELERKGSWTLKLCAWVWVAPIIAGMLVAM